MTRQNLVSALIAVMICALLVHFPVLKPDATTEVVGMLGAYILGLFRPHPLTPEPPVVG